MTYEKSPRTESIEKEGPGIQVFPSCSLFFRSFLVRISPTAQVGFLLKSDGTDGKPTLPMDLDLATARLILDLRQRAHALQDRLQSQDREAGDPGYCLKKWSGRLDLNQRPPGPEPDSSTY